MAEHAVELFRRAAEAFNADGANIGAAGAPPPGIYVEEPEIVPFRAALEGIVYTGPTAWEQFWDATRESWSELRLEIDRIEPVGSGVLGVGRLFGTSQDTGARVEARVAFAGHVRDGLIWRNAVHLSEADARRELGGE